MTQYVISVFWMHHTMLTFGRGRTCECSKDIEKIWLEAIFSNYWPFQIRVEGGEVQEIY